MPLPKNFYDCSTKTLAKALLGTVLTHKSEEGVTSGRIVETEAYLSNNDPACHAANGKTKRNASMFHAPGHSYIYLIYGMYHCFNVVSAKQGVGEAVLVRAIEPLEGIKLMQHRRGTNNLHNLCNGPGKLCQAMGLTKAQDSLSLCRGLLTIGQPKRFLLPVYQKIKKTSRIGISKGKELPLRFYFENCNFIST